MNGIPFYIGLYIRLLSRSGQPFKNGSKLGILHESSSLAGVGGWNFEGATCSVSAGSGFSSGLGSLPLDGG